MSYVFCNWYKGLSKEVSKDECWILVVDHARLPGSRGIWMSERRIVAAIYSKRSTGSAKKSITQTVRDHSSLAV